MKNRKIQFVLTGLLSILLLGGCGEAPYQLTESEETIIVNYSAHVVSKFNNRQADGIKYVEITEEPVEEPAEEAEELVEMEEETEQLTLEDGTIASGEGTEESEPVQTATLNEVFGQEGVEFLYTGYELRKDYVQDSVYAVNASNGKIYLVLNIDIANNSETEAEVNNIDNGAIFRAAFIADGNEKQEVSAYPTLLTNDFSTYEKVIAPGETEQAVLLFEIPEEITQTEGITLTVEVNGESYQIIL